MAQFVEIDIDQGTDFRLDLEFRNDDGTLKNLSQYTFSSSIKKSYYSLSEAATFTVDANSANNGQIGLLLDAQTTSDIRPGRYVFDIKQSDTSNKIERIAEGIVTLNPQVTA